MAEGQNPTRKSKRIKERDQSVQRLKEWNDCNASKVLAFLNLEKSKSKNDLNQFRSKSVSLGSRSRSRSQSPVAFGNNPTGNELAPVFKEPRGRSALKATPKNQETPKSRVNKSEAKRAKSLSRSQQRLDLLFLRPTYKSPTNTIQGGATPAVNYCPVDSDEEICFHKDKVAVCANSVFALVSNVNPLQSTNVNTSVKEIKKPGNATTVNTNKDNPVNPVNATSKITAKDSIEPTTLKTIRSLSGMKEAAGGPISNSLTPEQTITINMNNKQNEKKDDINGAEGSDPPQTSTNPPSAPSPKNMEEAFQLLSNKIDTWGRELKEDIKKINDDKQTTDTEVQLVKEENVKIRRDLKEVRDELNICKNQIANLVGAVHKNRVTTRENKEGLKRIYYQSVKSNLIIRGVSERKEENTIQVVNDFFKYKLKIAETIQLQAAYRIAGSGPDKAIVAVLSKTRDKGLVFKNVSNLKNVTNHDGKPYRIENQLPGDMSEREARHRDLVRKNRKLQGSADQLSMSLKKGVLTVDETVYKKQVKAPSVAELVLNDQKPSFKVTRGTPIAVDGSTFVGFSTAVRTLSDVNKAYIAVQNLEPESRSVMCGFRIPGRAFHTLQDYSDDDEHGGGRAILRLLEKSEIRNRAVFVARVFHGEHIGRKRFDEIVNAAKSAISRSTYNEITKEHQFPWTPEEWQDGGKKDNRPRRGGLTQGRGFYPQFHNHSGNLIDPAALGNTDDEGWNVMDDKVDNNKYNWDEVEPSEDVPTTIGDESNREPQS